MKNDYNTWLLRYLYVFLFFRDGLKLLWYVREEQRQGQTTRDCYIDPYLLLLLTMTHCDIFKIPFSTSTALWSVMLNRRPLSLTASWLSLKTSLTPTDQQAFACNISIRLQLSIRLCDLLPLIYVIASLTDGSVKGQYATCGCTINYWVHCYVRLAACLFFMACELLII